MLKTYENVNAVQITLENSVKIVASQTQKMIVVLQLLLHNVQNVDENQKPAKLCLSFVQSAEHNYKVIKER